MSSKTFHRQYYFAFGSNMSLTQMAERCPGSTFIGKATLRGYKWQINQRHVANIVKVTEDVSSVAIGQENMVEGLVFSITDKDRRILDRKEGIKLGVYERVVLDVLLERHPKFAEAKTAFVRDRLQDESNAIERLASRKETTVESHKTHISMPDRVKNVADVQPWPSVLSKRLPPSVKRPAAEVEKIEAITYLSTRYADSELIRQEYVQRMENAISDALKLDVSRDFVENHLEPYIHGDVYQPEDEVQENVISDRSVLQSGLEEGKRKADSGPALQSTAGQLGQRAHQTKKKTKSKDRPLRGEDRENSSALPSIAEVEQVARKDQDKGPAGFWSSVSSIFGSGQSQGNARAFQNR